MARSRARRLLPLLTFVTLGMVLGSLLQLVFFRRLDKDDHSHLVHVNHDQEAAVLRLGYVKPEVISWKPRIIVFHNFLSSEECDYLRDIARPRLEISTVVDVATGKGVKSDVRTSSGMFVNSEERKLPVIQVSSRYLRLAREHKHGKRYLRLAREHKHGKCMNDESGNDLHHSIILNSGGEIVELIPEKYI